MRLSPVVIGGTEHALREILRFAEIVREVDAGVVVEPGPSEIAGGLRRLLLDEAANHAMGERGRAHVIAHYSWAAAARRMEQLYRSVLAPA